MQNPVSERYGGAVNLAGFLHYLISIPHRGTEHDNVRKHRCRNVCFQDCMQIKNKQISEMGENPFAQDYFAISDFLYLKIILTEDIAGLLLDKNIP